ncbi:hypothetical protein Pmar_PMAR003489 [Perkinsus marinus ATCC 50983]|uniref:Uncharacterized protein n=1 Tax=Perkinsus marinus (strain ATCC 50983 / TXsc) TaxID=423536 RepID=C5KHG4_PERM5|nr:hypothetical protein Pmar_PMAR003489 [Perkinsus marinus ATCC 50983]EER16026.1 hypothetical protein Pmar_PMAR003489 [Perkinsus marinus ATCC 50983]|eukprot:XP_002784230.1 hypothetical protein Pmar_PMAR003489 [Perkinsus marinus ATCC 50983]
MAWGDDLPLVSWDKTDDPTVVLDLPFDTTPSTTPQEQPQLASLPASPDCGTLSTCSSNDVACGMSSPPFSALPPLSDLEALNGPFAQPLGFLGSSTGVDCTLADSIGKSAATTSQEPGLDALSRIIAARCVDPLTLPRAAVQDYDQMQQGPAPKRARLADTGADLSVNGLATLSASTNLSTLTRPTPSDRGHVSPYMMLNSLRKKEYAAPPGVWKNSGGYISTVYVNKRRIYGPLRKTLAESVRDREEMLIAKERHASEEEIRELVAALKEINGGGSRGSSKGRRHRKTQKTGKTTNSCSVTSTTSGGSSGTSAGGLFPTIPEPEAGLSGAEFPSLAARFQNENYFGGFSPDSIGFGQY